jgi:hypothetical protein
MSSTIVFPRKSHKPPNNPLFAGTGLEGTDPESIFQRKAVLILAIIVFLFFFALFAVWVIFVLKSLRVF